MAVSFEIEPTMDVAMHRLLLLVTVVIVAPVSRRNLGAYSVLLFVDAVAPAAASEIRLVAGAVAFRLVVGLGIH